VPHLSRRETGGAFDFAYFTRTLVRHTSKDKDGEIQFERFGFLVRGYVATRFGRLAVC
jgi:hypothetical protein